MSQTTRTVTANQDGTAYTADYNDALAAMDTCHSGSSAPTDEVLDGKFWLDTSGTNPILKIYRGAWVPLFEVTTSGSTLLGTVTDDSHNHVISNIDGLQAAIDASQKNVSGTVRAKLYKGNVIITGRKSPFSLYVSYTTSLFPPL